MSADSEARTKVKFCGITSLEDARFTAGALVDYMGFVFFEESPRAITPAKAGAIINWVEGLSCVGVFVNQPLDDVNMISRQTGVDLVQLHGEETPGYCSLIDKPVIKAIRVDRDTSPESLQEEVNPYLAYVDYLLFDTKVDEQWGGTGQSFDWNILNEVSKQLPFFLAGGLNADNIQSACKQVNPFAVDVSSGIENEPGVKSFDKIESFMNQMQNVWDLQENR
jgi:phosphoribosylanthranilate isomerase